MDPQGGKLEKGSKFCVGVFGSLPLLLGEYLLSMYSMSSSHSFI